LGIRFRIFTDQFAPQWLWTKKELTARLMRWALKLEQYDYKVVYKSGKLNKDRDLLSRYPVEYPATGDLGCLSAGDTRPVDSGNELWALGYTGSGEHHIVAHVELSTYNERMIIEAQQQDEQCQGILSGLSETQTFAW